MNQLATFETELVHRLLSLEEGDFVIVQGPMRTIEQRVGVFRRRTQSSQVGLFAQLIRSDNILCCELVGGPHVGGDFPWTDEEDQALRELGWSPQRGPQMYGAFIPDATPSTESGELDETDVRRAANLVMQSLTEVAGVSSVQEFTLSTGEA